MSQYQKGKTNLDFTEARDSEWQWHQVGHMQVCPSLQTENHASTPPLSFFTGRMPFLPPNQQHQSTEGMKSYSVIRTKLNQMVFKNVDIIIDLQEKHIYATTQLQTFLRVLRTTWRLKPAGIDIKQTYVTVTLCILPGAKQKLGLTDQRGWRESPALLNEAAA